MPELTGPQSLYHGSNQSVDNPDPFHGSLNKDFGQGFYTIPSYQDAAEWAAKIARRRGGLAVVNEYVYAHDDRITCHCFDRSETELLAWIDFILFNRGLKRLIGYAYKNPFGQDIIIGPIADFAIARSFEQFTLSQEVHFDSLGFADNPNKFKLRLIEDLDIEQLDDQVCFKNIASVKCLSFVRAHRC